jgi:uncharacterized protein
MQDEQTRAPASPRRPLDPSSITRPDPALRTYYLITSALTLFLFPFVYLPLYFKYHTLRYRFDEEGVSMSWGRFFQRETYLTYKRIQDIRVSRGVIQRWLGLSELALQTASGGSSAEMKIEGIRDADALRDFLYERMRGARDGGEEDGAGGVPPLTGAAGAGTEPGMAAPGGAGVAVADEALALLVEIRDELRRVNQGRTLP